MLTRIVRWSVVHPWMVVLAAALLTAFGIATVEIARYDVFPDFVPPQASIQTEAPGLAAEQVEALVTRPIEGAINGANGVASVRSESTQGLSVVTVQFRGGSDPYRSRQVVTEALGELSGRLPTTVATPRVSPMTSSTMDLLKVGFISDRLTPLQLRDVVQWTVRPRLLATPGVARAVIYGGEERRIEIRVKLAELAARNLSVTDVANAAAAMTAVRGGGFVDTPEQRILIEPGVGELDAKAIGAALIAGGTGPSVRIADVADVVAAPTPKFGDALIMGRPGVLISTASQYGANTLEATRAVEATLAELRPALEAQGVKIYPALHRPANFIEAGLGGIVRDLIIGALLIGFVLIAFLRNARVALITFVSIPVSLLTALIVLDRMGMNIDTMTLGGLAVALGVVVDDAIVDIENIVRRLRTDGVDRAETIVAASVEVRAPVVYATYVLVLTIAPILFLTGLQGAFFAPLALSFTLAVLASLAVASTVTPALAMLLLAQHDAMSEAAFLTRAKLRLGDWLTRACAQSDRVVAIAAATGVLALLGASLFGAELLPQFRERHYVLAINGPPGASLDWMRSTGARLSHELLAIPDVATVSHQIGRAEAGEDPFGPNRSEIHLELKPDVGGSREDTALARIRAVLARYPAITSEALTFLGDRIGESLSGETAAVAINIYGSDLDLLDRTAAQIVRVVAALPGAADVAMKSPPGTPTLRIRLDPDRMALRGVGPTDADDAIESAFQGRIAAQVAAGDRVTDVAVVLPPDAARDPESIADVSVRGSDGTLVKLGDIANIDLVEGRSLIAREAGQRRQVVTANPTGRDVAGFVVTAQHAIAAKIKLPPGVSLSFTGEAAGQAAAKRQIAANVGVAAIGILALLILAFGGLRAAALILAGTPFALAGGVVAVALTGGVLSLGALVGFVTLFGIAARNAILLVSHVDHLVADEGAPFDLATVVRAAQERLIPILMTAIVTALGLLPLAVEAGQSGREVQGPMAIVILGGLFTSTIMSLLLLPALILRYRHAGAATEG